MLATYQLLQTAEQLVGDRLGGHAKQSGEFRYCSNDIPWSGRAVVFEYERSIGLSEKPLQRQPADQFSMFGRAEHLAIDGKVATHLGSSPRFRCSPGEPVQDDPTAVDGQSLLKVCEDLTH
ncbi:hypothetical protein C7405_102209 [Paraburkholderia caballeronis]|nr:hypothetical protein C7405_102209 [Paraburkholderia caballeronis]